ncbi:FdhF/YdeP family oxidoreductase [Agrobacterium rosae]|uniref:CbbBc protein n=1 Tax=Agrobacterium rosae TaxID=1972867 RepID=A0AAE5RWI1_9HYPH|nr:FdhF/YdeP family oxidoreductase [Agrobacterium rosae]KAA3509903.1 CbbBc protein [Agrobacterium rosae]KAA3515148.1 CbbBc protein [Agrobacterium rosae]MCM2433105.1 FdhF/YdeP family oxidoreductase [Agrobacterium rosae]MDX8331436.1 FdhF/YdeP family oxidoreductase [Agrobacterium rosae]MQB50490.1 CbbBc protein [Agrobacterium rosae]
MGKMDFIGKASSAAGGWGALKSVGKRLLESGAPISGARALLKANQPDGFDCPGCAWGDPEHGSSFEFCENGVKAVAWEATEARVPPDFFASHKVSELRTWSDYNLEKQGRLTDPLRYDSATDKYLPVSWDDAFAEIGKVLRSLDSPDRAEFYTSGRASNEAAFLYQLMVRLYGTNNFPDCSNMCHEASGVGLKASVGVGKGTVLLEDFEKADAIFVIGQNPGTNHPRMLGDLRRAAIRGARIAVFNPIREKGLERFTDPQDKIEMITGGNTKIATNYYQPRQGGDMAAVRGMSKAVFAADDAARAAGKPAIIDYDFLAEHAVEFDAYRAAVEATSWETILDQSGLSREQIEEAASIYMASNAVIATWAMGITQHKHSVITIREITNFMLLRGNIGRPGAGLCPVRGHSNVQGDRTVGIDEKAPPSLLDALEKELGVPMPRNRGHNTVEAISAMLDGKAQAFIALGGNFLRATPDSPLIIKAFEKQKLTVNIATKLNHSHLVPGETSFILPCLGRTEIDRNSQGKPQIVTVEDSMSMVHGSGGINEPASPELRSEIAIVAGIAHATLGNERVQWNELADDYDLIRDMISRVLPGFQDFNERVRVPRGFHLRNAAAEREWNTPAKKATFFTGALPEKTEHQEALSKHGIFVLQTFRSHDQYNTTIYGMDDRYRGVYGERQVIFMNPKDMEALGAHAKQRVDVIGEYGDGVERIAENFRLVPYNIPEGSVGGYYPELNVLVPLHSYGEGSFTPTSKSVLVSVRLRTEAEAA